MFSSLTMRHTMGQVREGRSLLRLPPKHVTEVIVEWGAGERAVYDALWNRARVDYQMLKRG
jgi:hypothetical protein